MGSIGVASALFAAASSSAFLALCAASRSFKFPGDSNLGFFAGFEPDDPGVGLPVAARRSASAWENCVITR